MNIDLIPDLPPEVKRPRHVCEIYRERGKTSTDVYELLTVQEEGKWVLYRRLIRTEFNYDG